MAKKTNSGYTTICPNCGEQAQSKIKAHICRNCGNIATVPPLTGGDFEKLADGEIVELPEKKSKTIPAVNNDVRSADEGGRVF